MILGVTKLGKLFIDRNIEFGMMMTKSRSLRANAHIFLLDKTLANWSIRMSTSNQKSD